MTDNVESVERANKMYSDSDIKGWGVRHTQCILLFLTLSCAYLVRSFMAVALVAMVHNENTQMKNNMSISYSYIGIDNSTNTSHIPISKEDFKLDGIFNTMLIIPPFPTFKWSKKIQDMILAAFFWGYMCFQIPAGQIAHWFGARHLLSSALAINSIILFIMPVASYYGDWICTLICRICLGLSQACVLPGLHTILGKWAPIEERGRMGNIMYGGQPFGAVIGLPLTGLIASSELGWPGIFYIYGLLSGIVSVILWCMLANSPSQHKSISLEEKRYIEEALGQTNNQRIFPVPWRKILSCPGLVAIVASHIGFTWGKLTILTEIPSYMDKVMGVNIKTNGLLAALPFLMHLCLGICASWLADILIVKKYLNVTQTRKLANSFGTFLPAIGMIALAYAPSNIYVIETLLTLSFGLNSAVCVGFYVNHVDISPNFAGTMMSISNFVGNAIGSLSPVVAGLILTDVTNPLLWRQVFFISAGFYFITNLFYLIFGTGELAEWNDPTCYNEVPLHETTKIETDATNLESDQLL